MRRRLSIAPLSSAFRMRVNEFPSQRSCARAIGISEATLSGILSKLARGDAEVGVAVACRIAVFVGRDPREEFKLAELPERAPSGVAASAPRRTEPRGPVAVRTPAAWNEPGLQEPLGGGLNGHVPSASSSPTGSAESKRKLRVFLSHKIGGDLTGASVTEAAIAIGTFLDEHGFEILSGGDITGHLGPAARRTIASCDRVVALITADPATSGPVVGSETIVRRASIWVMQEIAAALSLGKPVVLLAEKDVEFGEFHGDRKVHYFTGIEILRAMYDVLNELRNEPMRERPRVDSELYAR